MDPFAPSKKYFLLRIQFLGFRYHGWQKQPGVKTVQLMVEKTIRYVLGENVKFKILGGSRTDAMVSADDFPFELFLESGLPLSFLEELNKNLPNDIKALNVKEVEANFNVIQDVVLKEYHYFFQYGVEHNPFQAPFITHIHQNLDVDKMGKAANFFIGERNFSSFSYPFKSGVNKVRTVEQSMIEASNQNGIYIYKVKSAGFMRYQVRLMMGALLEIGKGLLAMEKLEEALQPNSCLNIAVKAPASGLRLHSVEYENY